MPPWKRAFDLALAVPGLFVAGPLILGLAAAVRATSPGPAFFRQRRVGRGRSPIEVLKLRTMVADAERLGPAVTSAGDSRITPLGRLLRRAKLDELPQLWNVLRGDMSIVGPRPEAERFVARFRPEWERIHAVRPGITDPASLVFRDEEALLARARDRERAYVEVVLPAKMRLALEGVDRSSVVEDARLVIRTIGAVLGLGGGAAGRRILDEVSRAIDALDRGRPGPNGKAPVA